MSQDAADIAKLICKTLDSCDDGYEMACVTEGILIALVYVFRACGAPRDEAIAFVKECFDGYWKDEDTKMPE